MCSEKFEIPKEKSKISIIGAGASKTIIFNEDTAETAGSTSKSATVAVMSDYFIAQDITFQVSTRDSCSLTCLRTLSALVDDQY